jgi:glycosyltransferase involved in cell wall biosynthesis
MHDPHGDAARTRTLAAQARAEADALVDAIVRGPASERPDVFFTYHVHYKAPDVIGPAVASALEIPYIVAEGSRAPKRAGGPWAVGHELAEAALDRAACILVLNERDREVLERIRPPGQRLVALPPFIDADRWPDYRGQRNDRSDGGAIRLLTVAMMRQGDKLASYRLLADALHQLPRDLNWLLDVVGDGPAHGSVHELFKPFETRVRFHGIVHTEVLLAGLYGSADLFVWPGVNEAYGMVFLEAALQGCPAIAGRFGGIPGVVIDGVTGRLVQGGDAGAFAAGLTELIGNPDVLRSLGGGAAAFARGERTLPRAAQVLRTILDDLLVDGGREAG